MLFSSEFEGMHEKTPLCDELTVLMRRELRVSPGRGAFWEKKMRRFSSELGLEDSETSTSWEKRKKRNMVFDSDKLKCHKKKKDINIWNDSRKTSFSIIAFAGFSFLSLNENTVSCFPFCYLTRANFFFLRSLKDFRN